MNDILQQLTQLRDNGQHRHDPVHFQYLESFAQRLANGRQPPAKKYQQKLQRSLTTYQVSLPTDNTKHTPTAVSPSPLTQLVETLRQGSEERTPRDLKALAPMQELRTRQLRHRRIQQAINHAPDDAGPLNAHRQLARALSTLQEISPLYLERLATHMDDLMVLEKAAKK